MLARLYPSGKKITRAAVHGEVQAFLVVSEGCDFSAREQSAGWDGAGRVGECRDGCEWSGTGKEAEGQDAEIERGSGFRALCFAKGIGITSRMQDIIKPQGCGHGVVPAREVCVAQSSPLGAGQNVQLPKGQGIVSLAGGDWLLLASAGNRGACSFSSLHLFLETLVPLRDLALIT